jgi:hypothetical protein
MVKTYNCDRCGHEFRLAIHLRDHLGKRQTPCDPLVSDASPGDLLSKHLSAVRKYTRKGTLAPINGPGDDTAYNAPVQINNYPSNCTIIGTNNIYLVPHMKEEHHGFSISDEDILRIASKPLDTAMEEYVRLKNFTAPETKNIASVLNDRTKVVSETFQWEAKSTRKCSKALLSSFILRLYKILEGMEDNYALRQYFVHRDWRNCEEVLCADDSGESRSWPMIRAIERGLYAESQKWYPRGICKLPDVLKPT